MRSPSTPLSPDTLGAPRVRRPRAVAKATIIHIHRSRDARVSSVVSPGPLAFPVDAPHIFVHEGARQALERRLAHLLEEQVHLAITDNHRTMLSSRVRGGVRHVRMHHMFLSADTGTLRAAARHVVDRDREATRHLGRFIEANRRKIRASRQKAVRVVTRGRHYDLRRIFDELNASHFGGRVDCGITWGKRGITRSRMRQSIRLGTYSADDRLIRIHPRLDAPWVPAFFIAYVVFHEMLHHVIPARVRQGRALHHSDEFKAREREFPDFERALRWEQRFVQRLLAVVP